MKNDSYAKWIGKKIKATEEYVLRYPPTPEIANQIGIVVGYHTGQMGSRGSLCTVWPPCPKRDRNGSDYLLSRLRKLDLEEVNLKLVPGGHFLCIWANMHEVYEI